MRRDGSSSAFMMSWRPWRPCCPTLTRSYTGLVRSIACEDDERRATREIDSRLVYGHLICLSKPVCCQDVGRLWEKTISWSPVFLMVCSRLCCPLSPKLKCVCHSSTYKYMQVRGGRVTQAFAISLTNLQKDVWEPHTAPPAWGINTAYFLAPVGVVCLHCGRFTRMKIGKGWNTRNINTKHQSLMHCNVREIICGIRNMSTVQSPRLHRVK
jgi:hypothetical protein